jgi:hypothetical protein
LGFCTDNIFTMKITKAHPSVDHVMFRTGSVHLSKDEITRTLGFGPSTEDGAKVKYMWRFYVDGVLCAVWDYKGSGRQGEHSIYAPALIGKALFDSSFTSEYPYKASI